MGLMDKFKNLFTEEVEEDEPIKKEVIQVEIPSPKEEKKERRIKDEVEPAIELPEETVKYEPVEKPKEEYKFPFFDDEDFEIIEEKAETRKEKKKGLYSRSKEAYNPPKEEKHQFKPTPIISPVYGILDKNYVKDDIKPKAPRASYYNPKEATIDEIRNKAYGSLEDEVEHELFDSEDRALYEPVDTEDDLFIEMEKEIPNFMDEEPIARHAKANVKKEDELTSLLEQEMSKEANKTKDEPSKISDKELFNLIDSMYERGDKQ